MAAEKTTLPNNLLRVPFLRLNPKRNETGFLYSQTREEPLIMTLCKFGGNEIGIESSSRGVICLIVLDFVGMNGI